MQLPHVGFIMRVRLTLTKRSGRNEVAGELKINRPWCSALRKVSARWIPKHLHHDLKERLEDVVETRLRHFETEDGFVRCLCTRYKCWVQCFHPEKSQPAGSDHILPGRHQRSVQLCPLGNWCSRSHGTVKGPVLGHYMLGGITVNKETLLWSAWESLGTCNQVTTLRFAPRFWCAVTER